MHRRFIVLLIAISTIALGPPVLVKTAAAEDVPNVGDEPDWLKLKGFELDKLMAMLTDPAMRDLVCQLANNKFSPGTLAQVGGFQKTRDLLSRIEQLEKWGVIQTRETKDGITVIEAVPGHGEETLRRWAGKYCAKSDSCGASG